MAEDLLRQSMGRFHERLVESQELEVPLLSLVFIAVFLLLGEAVGEG